MVQYFVRYILWYDRRVGSKWYFKWYLIPMCYMLGALTWLTVKHAHLHTLAQMRINRREPNDHGQEKSWCSYSSFYFISQLAECAEGLETTVHGPVAVTILW